MELLVKYIFCYILAVLSLIMASKMSDDELLKFVLINVSSSLVVLPIVFIFYDLYKKALSYKASKLVNKVIEKDINDIFLKFIYFTTHFYKEFTSEQDYDAYELDNELKKNEKEIFEKVSGNIHHGYFIFSIFDDFSRDINRAINKDTIIKSISLKELAVLQQFINDFSDFKNCFSWIQKNDFIKYKDLSGVLIIESKHAKSEDDDEVLYDVSDTSNKEKIATYYMASYRLFESPILTSGYKFSGNKSFEISNCLFKLYSDINKWKKIKNIDNLHFDNCTISANRLHLDSNIVFNEHMNTNFSIRSQF